jgi:hypothetical protein
MAGKSLFTGIPFKETPQPVPVAWVAADKLTGGSIMSLLGAAGWAYRRDDGRWLMDEKNLKAAQDFYPLLQTMRRLVPGDNKREAARIEQTWFNWVTGGGVRINTPQEQESERRRRQFKERDDAAFAAALRAP